MKYKVLIAAALAATVVQASTLDESLPEPWFKNGQAPAVHDCQAGVDGELEAQGLSNITLKCSTNEQGFVSVMQVFDAADYRGTRIRYSAEVKADSVEQWGGLWMRIDDVSQHGASFDNMQNRPVEGSHDWTRREIVLDASVNADSISLGTLMVGKGQLWIRNVQLETVGRDVPVTDSSEAGSLPERPLNLELTR